MLYMMPSCGLSYSGDEPGCSRGAYIPADPDPCSAGPAALLLHNTIDVLMVNADVKMLGHQAAKSTSSTPTNLSCQNVKFVLLADMQARQPERAWGALRKVPAFVTPR